MVGVTEGVGVRVSAGGAKRLHAADRISKVMATITTTTGWNADANGLFIAPGLPNCANLTQSGRLPFFSHF